MQNIIYLESKLFLAIGQFLVIDTAIRCCQLGVFLL